MPFRFRRWLDYVCCMKWTFVFAVIAVVCQTSFAQLNSFPNEHRSMRADINSFYWYDSRLTYYPNYQVELIDTLNYCRVKRNKIKSVTVYSFTTESDSVRVSQTAYDSTGRTWYMRTFFDSTVLCVPCDSVHYQTYESDGRFHYPMWDRTWWTDEAGYISKYKEVSSGLLRRLVQYIDGARPDEIIVYQYDSTYSSVTASSYECSDYLIFRIWDRHPRFISKYKSDRYGNLKSDFMYERMDDGKLEMLWGFKYYYEYY